MERWAQLREFPDYSVSDHGNVRNDITGRIMRLSHNQHGVTNVGLMKQGIQYKRGVALLVANAFVERLPGPFDTPINIDGDRTNNCYDNLMWRPRWFAIKYHQQFHERPVVRTPIIEVNSREKFHNSRHAAVTFGLLERDILDAIHNKTFVFPTYQVFELA